VAEENVDLIRGYYAGMNARKLDSVLAILSPEVVFHPADVFPDLDPVYRGHDEFLKFARDFAATWEELSLEPLRFIGLDNRVLVPVRFHAQGREGIETNLEIFQLWTIENGLVTRLDAYSNAEEASAALGVPVNSIVE